MPVTKRFGPLSDHQTHRLNSVEIQCLRNACALSRQVVEGDKSMSQVDHALKSVLELLNPSADVVIHTQAPQSMEEEYLERNSMELEPEEEAEWLAVCKAEDMDPTAFDIDDDEDYLVDLDDDDDDDLIDEWDDDEDYDNEED